jgi:hypothetical protein
VPLYRVHQPECDQKVVETNSVHSYVTVIANRHQPPTRHTGSRRHEVEVQGPDGQWSDAGYVEHKPDGTAAYIPAGQ